MRTANSRGYGDGVERSLQQQLGLCHWIQVVGGKPEFPWLTAWAKLK